MPIRPENKSRYPADWPQIRARILDRARHECEWCHLRNGAWGWRDVAGVFHPAPKQQLIEMRRSYPGEWIRPPFEIRIEGGMVKIIEIVLTIAHLDHTPEHCDDDNLRALCQRCHLLYDVPHHRVTAYMSRRANRNTLELPL